MDLKQIRHLSKEIKSIQKNLDGAKTDGGRVTDVVKGSNAEYPYQPVHFTIEGHQDSQYARLQRKLHEKMNILQQELYDFEEFLDNIEDAQERTIARLYFGDGETQEDIASALNISVITVKRKIKVISQNDTK